MSDCVQVKLRDDEGIEIFLFCLVQGGHHIMNVKHDLFRIADYGFLFKELLTEIFNLITIHKGLNLLVLNFTALKYL